jgi:hypothetical protein
MVAASPELQEQLKDDPVGTLKGLVQPLESDPWIYRIVVGSLGLSALLVVVLVFVLVVNDPEASIPDAMVAIGSAAIAALAALLVPQNRLSRVRLRRAEGAGTTAASAAAARSWLGASRSG